MDIECIESKAGVSPGLTFVSNDKANHPLAIISLPELKDDAGKKGPEWSLVNLVQILYSAQQEYSNHPV